MRLEATKHTRDGVLSSGPSASLPARNSRPCNALSFSPTDPNYLAVGLEKVRGDCSLVIWDIISSKPALSFGNAKTFGVGNDGLEPKRPLPLIPRGDFGPKTDVRLLQMHAPTEVVSSLAFAPNAHNLLWAGISHRWLRLFDVRTALPSTSNVATKVQGIATDPFVPTRVATFDDGIVSIWDCRRLPQPILTFSEHDAYGDGAKSCLNPPTFATIEFSSVRRGTIATLEKDSVHVRSWDLQEAQFHEVTNERSRDSSVSGGRTSGGKLSWANPSSMLSWTASSGGNIQVAEARRDRDPSPSTRAPSTILADTRKSESNPQQRPLSF
jgi:WD40 repeat protein